MSFSSSINSKKYIFRISILFFTLGIFDVNLIASDIITCPITEKNICSVKFKKLFKTIKHSEEFIANDSTFKNKFETFNELPALIDIRENNQIGKQDPFSIDEDYKYRNITLYGVFSVNNKNFAMIKYKDEMGEVLEGSVGGKETYLLPKNVKLKKVDVINHMILIEFNDTEFTLTLD